MSKYASNNVLIPVLVSAILRISYVAKFGEITPFPQTRMISSILSNSGDDNRQ